MIDDVILCTKYLWNGVEIKGLQNDTVHIVADLNEGISTANLYQLANRPRDAKKVVVWAYQDNDKKNGRKEFVYTEGDYLTLSRDVLVGDINNDVKSVFGDIEFDTFIGDEKACDRLRNMFSVIRPTVFSSHDSIINEWKMYYNWIEEGETIEENVSEEGNIERDIEDVYDVLYAHLDDDNYFSLIPAVAYQNTGLSNFTLFDKTFKKVQYLRGRIDNTKYIFTYGEKADLIKNINRAVLKLKSMDEKLGLVKVKSDNRDKLNSLTIEHFEEMDEQRQKRYSKIEDDIIDKEMIDMATGEDEFAGGVSETREVVTITFLDKKESGKKGGKVSGMRRAEKCTYDDIEFDSKTDAIKYIMKKWNVSESTAKRRLKSVK